MTNELAGRGALVTGAGMGIGRACAMALAATGARVMAQDIDAAAAQDTAAEIRATGGAAQVLAFDVVDTTELRRAVTRCEDDGQSIDVLINNAGIGSGLDLAAVTEEVYDRLFAVNVRAVFFGTQAVTAGMKRRRWGRIVNVSSLQAVRGWPGNPH
jgi:NAD(P)-dependent dehydrogenase (short-subunit alcohol dehydrogenase family)